MHKKYVIVSREFAKNELEISSRLHAFRFVNSNLIGSRLHIYYGTCQNIPFLCGSFRLVPLGNNGLYEISIIKQYHTQFL